MFSSEKSNYYSTPSGVNKPTKWHVTFPCRFHANPRLARLWEITSPAQGTLCTMDGKPRLLDRLREQIRIRHYSLRTEAAYVYWVRAFIRFHKLRHPEEMGAAEVEQFLYHWAVPRNVSASTQNQALAGLLFLYKQVLKTPLPWLDEVVRAKRSERLPVVLSVKEVRRWLACFDGEIALVANLLYGSGLRLMEAVRLRVKDVDFARREIVVRDGQAVRTVQELLGHADVKATMIYTHVLNRGGYAVRSPLDR